MDEPDSETTQDLDGCQTMYGNRFSEAMRAGEDTDQADLPPHLLLLSKGQWGLWQTFGLRGAGFPVTEVLKLSAPECADLADKVVAAENAMREAREKSLNALESEFDALRRDQQWDDKSRREPLVKALQRLKKGRLPEPIITVGVAAEAIEDFRRATAQLALLSGELRKSYDEALANTSQAIYEILHKARFREAITWQNRRAWNGGINSLLQNPPVSNSRNSKRKRNEELVASYLQRYSVKNDTIGFFGPVSWARFVADGDAIDFKPGPGLLASRSVFFEAWGIDALAEMLAKDKLFKPWFAPRLMPFTYLDQVGLHLPGGGSLKLSARQTAVLRGCDGKQVANHLAADLLQNSPGNFKDEQEIYAILDSFEKMGVITWTLEVPLRKHPNQLYRKLVERIGEASLREPALKILSELEAARDGVADAAGDPEKLNQALNELEEKFVQLTGVAATTASGRTYAARTLIYEDCRRDAELNIGPQVWQDLKQPLSLLLTSARWMSFEIARLYRKAFKEIYVQLAEKRGSSVVSAVDFWMKADPLIYKANLRIADSIVPIFQRLWSDVFRLPEGERHVCYTSEQLRPRIEAAFAAPRPGWSHARYHSPDLMLAASDLEAIRRGQYHWVVGELHLTVNSLNAVSFMSQHPRPEEVYKAVEADFPEPRIVPVPPKHWGDLTARTGFDFVPPQDYRLEIARDTCDVTLDQALSIGSLVVEDTAEGLMLRSRDNRIRFEIIEGLGEFLSSLMINFFSPLAPGRHRPRVTIDRLVVCRESWLFSPSEISFAYQESEAARFVGARRWMCELGLPRFIFIKSPIERKPLYVDLDSPIYVEMFAKIIHRTGESDLSNPLISVSEMLPAHDQSWLIDAEENHYTSELRMVVVDLAR